MGRSDQRCGQLVVLLVQDEGEYIHLVLADGDKGDARSMIEDGKGEGDAFGGRLGRVVEIGNPSVSFGEQLVAWEKGASVAVWTDAEKDKVKDGEARRVLLGELVDELLFVGICEFLEIVELSCVDGVDVGRGDGNMVKELGHAELVV